MKSIFSKNLKAARRLKGWTQKEAAQKLFRSQKAYAKWEEGRSEPPQETLLLICDVFEILDLRLFISMEDYFAKKSRQLNLAS